MNVKLKISGVFRTLNTTIIVNDVKHSDGLQY
jgi:hypothetical protein